jgi:hypothetical protein
MAKQEPEETRRELTEIEEWELERKLLDLAYMNSYLVLTEKATFEDLMLENHAKGKSAVLAHDPHEGVTIREVNGIINHFIDLEEYEKCAELKDVLGTLAI